MFFPWALFTSIALNLLSLGSSQLPSYPRNNNIEVLSEHNQGENWTLVFDLVFELQFELFELQIEFSTESGR